ncbi:MAG: RidA family protein [Sphingobacteriia bacterium]|nr:RidA family protein [Sphingobacteriia bacterium]
MDKHIIETAEAPAPIGPYSQAVSTGSLLFVSGQIALDAKTGTLKTESLETETQKVMENIGAILKAKGMTYKNIVKTTIFLRDMNDFALVNQYYGSYFESEFPARETVEVSRLPKDVNVEISVIATL